MAASLLHFLIGLALTCKCSVGLVTDQFSIYMPNVKPENPETYLCTPVRVDASDDYYIVGFEPNATMDVAHHMLLYGCSYPGQMEEVYNCNEMASANQPGLKTGQPCARGSQILYAWARDAPRLNLPKGVAFKVGGNTAIQYLVLQVHYADVTTFVEDGKTDASGVSLIYTEVPQPKTAGVYFLGTNGFIGPKTTEFMEAACVMNENVVLHPFAFRVHTHSLGRVVSGYRVRHGMDGYDKWTLLGKKNPMRPQMFYPIEKDMIIKKGDILASRCTMVSDRNRLTRIGPTNEDEMCNFYIMYWKYGDKPLRTNYCFTMGPPFYRWGRGGLPLNNIPNMEASTI